MAERHELTRKELYDLVWKKPITHLAKELDTPTSQLHKICQEYKIPRPLPGHWKKLEHGKEVNRRPLPVNVDFDYKPIIITSYGYAEVTPKQKKRKTVYIKSPIPVTKTLYPNRLHPIVLKTMNAGFEIDGYREIYGLHKPKDTCLDIIVYPETIRRSLLLADTIIKAIQARGYKLKIGIGKKRRWSSCQTYEADECYFDIKGEKVRFAISEKINRIERPLSQEEKRELERDGFIFHRYKYLSSGILKVKILEASYRENTWMDNGRMTVEQQIPFIIKAILIAADDQKKSRISSKIEERQMAEEERQAELKRLLKKQEKKRIHDLMIQVKKWKKAVAIRNYLNAFEEAMGSDEYRDHDMKYWLDWAHGYANKIDPLTMFSK